MPSPDPPPRPLPPRRDRGGLCRWRSAVSGYLLPLGRRLLRGRGRSLACLLGGARAAAAVAAVRARGSAGLGWARLCSAGLGQARPTAKTAKSPASWKAGGRRPVWGGTIPTPLQPLNWLAAPDSRAIGRELGWGLARPLGRRGGAGGRQKGLLVLILFQGEGGGGVRPTYLPNFLHLLHLEELNT